MFHEHIRYWPHRFGCLPRYDGFLSEFNGASPQGYYSDILSWEGFIYELRMFRLGNPHAYIDRMPLPENEDEEWIESSGPIRFDFLKADEKIFNKKVLKTENMQLSVVLQPLNFSIGYIQNNFAHRLYYVIDGSVEFKTPLGNLYCLEGNYAFIPKGMVYTWTAQNGSALVLSIESRDILFSPFVQPAGMFFPFDFASLVLPETNELDYARGREEYRILEKDNAGKTYLKRVPSNPFDVVAWSGYLYPFVLDSSDIKTLSSHNFHLSPDSLATFVTQDYSVKISTFQPRILHSLPFSHRNVDFDEFLLYLSSYTARDVKKGQASLHPRGFHHGPEKKVSEQRPDLKSGVVDSLEKCWTEEKAIMIESQEPMLVNKRALNFFSEI